MWFTLLYQYKKLAYDWFCHSKSCHGNVPVSWQIIRESCGRVKISLIPFDLSCNIFIANKERNANDVCMYICVCQRKEYYKIYFLSVSDHFVFIMLTHWGRDKMAAICQTTFSNAFSWMKMNEFRLGFHWSLFLRFEITIFHHWFR